MLENQLFTLCKYYLTIKDSRYITEIQSIY
jgi:hypothetical protein